MKKINQILFIACAILASSASQAQSITITKRHYTGGYYVDFVSKKKAETKTTPAQSVKQNIASVNAAPISTIPLATAEAPEQMTMVAVNNTTIKTEKINKHVKPNYSVAAKSINTETGIAANNNYNSTSSADGNLNTRIAASTSNDAGVSLLIIVIITIFIPPLGVALVRGIHIEFWLDLILTLCFFIPGLIYGLIVVLS